MKKPTESIHEREVLAVIERRWPLHYEIAVQQAYIANLEAALKERDGGDELPDQS